jgi:hypothetical protein
MGIAKELKVEKGVKEEDISVGSEVTIFLKFFNPFNQPIFIKIKDKNIFAGSGLNVECFEYILPEKKEFSLEYEPLIIFSSGKFTLDPAEITYENPETGKEKTIKSNELVLEVKEGNKTFQKNLQQERITTIYQCGGTSIKSTQYSSSGTSGSSFSFSFGNSGMSQITQEMQRPKNIQDKLNEMQQQVKQDMNLLKKNMEEEIKKKEEMRKELSEKIENSKEFQKLERELKEKGYSLQKKEIEPENNATGKFNYQYSKGSKSASIHGDMKNGEIMKIQKWGEEDEKKLQEKLEKDEKFQQLEKNLIEKGFQLSEKKLSFPEDNYSEFNYSYINPEKNETTASIVGKISLPEGNVTQIKAVILEERKNEEGAEKEIFSWLLFLLILLIIFFIFFVTWRHIQKRRKIIPTLSQTEDTKEEEDKKDFRKIALDMIKEGKSLYEKGEKKKGYAKVSDGIRFYFKHIFGEKEELTDYEVINLLKKNKNEKLRITEECLNLCNLVKFAKYKPEDKDFHKIIEYAYEIVE